MKLLCAWAIALVSLLAQPSPTVNTAEDDAAPGTANINSRYRVEKVELARPIEKKLSRSLKRDIDSLVGQRFDPQVVAKLASRIHKEVHLLVRHRVEKGEQPDFVKVIYEPSKRK